MNHQPLTPPECDLRGLPYMPLDVVRLIDSDLSALSTGDEFKAAVTLWCKSWLQVPAASLPDDDRILAHLSGAGPRWRKVKEMALHGFILCRDGRWYHPVIAEKAVEAWAHRLKQRDKAAKRWHGGKPERGNATAHATAHATASPTADAPAMQGRGKVKNPPLPPEGDATLSGVIDAIWDESPAEARKRSSRKDLERAMKAAISRGGEPLAIQDALKAYYRSDQAVKDGGAFAKGVHRMVENDRWREWLNAAATGGRTPEGPDWPARVQVWRQTGRWIESLWGPEPGDPQCQCPAELLEGQ